MTRVCTVSHDISIMVFRINTAETLSATRCSRASTSADLDHAASQHIKEPNERCMLIVNRGVPGLVDRVFAVHAGSRRFDSHRRQMSERFFRSKRPRYPHPVCSELEIVVSEWPSVIAVSLNIGGGGGGASALSTSKTVGRGRTHGAGCVRLWFRTAEPLGERRYENWITYKHTLHVDL